MIGFDNDPNNHGDHLGSAYQGGWYSFLDKDLRQILGLPVKGSFSRMYCGRGNFNTCRTALRDSLQAALGDAAASLYDEDPGTSGTQRVIRMPLHGQRPVVLRLRRLSRGRRHHHPASPLDQPADLPAGRPGPGPPPALSTPGQVALWGSDHTELGEVAVRTLGGKIAIAISKGLTEKAYFHVDPNEDVVSASEGEKGCLLVAADGHNGREASEEVVKSVLERLGGNPPPADLSEGELVGLFHEAGEAVLRKTQDESCPNRDSRTTLTLALISGSRLQWASMGDTSLFVVSGAEARALGRRRRLFVGYPMTPDAVRERMSCDTARLRAGSWIVLATDGFADFAPFSSPEAAVEEALNRATRAEDVARQLVALAFEGGGGDNLAVAVLGPTG